jgi:SAM-dependent methyltransferase
MLAQPQARRAEFEQLFARQPLAAGETILDLPAGGGYLRGFIPAGCTLAAYELTAGFSGREAVLDPDAAWNLGRFDRVVCLAALHHIEDKVGFLAKLAGQLAPGGRLHAGDVDRASPIAEFLDGFVGRFNGTGHAGAYLDRETFERIDGLSLAAYEIRDCAWRFPSEAALVAFCTGLFGLRGCPADALLAALERHVGIAEEEAGGLRLDWRLTYVDMLCEK